MAQPTSLSLQVKLDSLKLPAGFDESGINGKLQKLWDRYYALVKAPNLSEADVEKLNQRYESERERILDENRDGKPDRVTAFYAKLGTMGLPPGFDETGLGGKVAKLKAIYDVIAKEKGLSPKEKQWAKNRYEAEQGRIVNEWADAHPEEGWVG